MKLVLASTEDQAAKNIVARLLELYNFKKSSTLPNAYSCMDITLMTITGGVTQITKLPVVTDEVIIASRHASESGKPSLTVHAPGEPSQLDFAIASPPTIKSILQALANARDELKLAYDVSLEATHHGPTKLEVPVTFVEIGSSPEQWRDEKAGEAVAHAIMAVAKRPSKCRNALGIGGPHYAPRHTDIVLHTDVGVGHILPKYLRMDDELIERAIVRTWGSVDLLALDWKGMNSEQRLLSRREADKLGIQTMNTKEILAHAKS